MSRDPGFSAVKSFANLKLYNLQRLSLQKNFYTIKIQYNKNLYTGYPIRLKFVLPGDLFTNL